LRIKSEEHITDESALKFVANIIAREHDSVLEHEKNKCFVYI